MPNVATSFKAARAENYPQVFLDPNGFAETVTQWPLGIKSGAVDFTGMVHMDEEGDQQPDDRNGSRQVRWCTISVPTTVKVTVDERSQQRDSFIIRGEIWAAQRILRRTPYRVRIRLRRDEPVSTKRTRER